jgi:hypothetical protein
LLEGDTEVDLLSREDGWKLDYGRSNHQEHVVYLGCCHDEGELLIAADNSWPAAGVAGAGKKRCCCDDDQDR